MQYALYLACAAVVGWGAVLSGPQDQRRHDRPDGKNAVAQAGKMFMSRCASCHSIPDPRLRSDRSWIEQVNRTT